MSSKENWDLIVDHKVTKATKRFPPKDKERISDAIEMMSKTPYAGDIEKMSGVDNAWRRRVGSYRIFFEVHQHEHMVYVFRVERRSSHTY